MNHHSSIKKFNRKRNQRKALMWGLARSFILKEKIKTTEAKAKSLRPLVEKLISKSKNDTLAVRRSLYSKIGNEAGKKALQELAPKYKNRSGGYVRIIKTENRKSDGSKMAVIEFT